MNVDKFGHHILKRSKVDSYVNSLNFNSGFIHARNKAIKHLGKPTDPTDSVTKEYVDHIVEAMSKKVTTLYQKLDQLEKEITSLKQNIDALCQKSKYAK